MKKPSTETIHRKGLFLSTYIINKMKLNVNMIRKLGLVEAGFPTAAEEDKGNFITLDELIIQNRNASYLLTVKGDSMCDAGILDGDLIVIEKRENAKVGQIVVASVDGEYTLKYLRQDKNKQYYLEAANAKYTDIYAENELQIQGILIAVIRKYK